MYEHEENIFVRNHRIWCGNRFCTAVAVSKPGAVARRKSRRPVLATDARREGCSDAKQLAGYTATRNTAVRMVERGSTRHRAQRLLHALPIVYRNGGIVRRRAVGKNLYCHK